MEFVGLVLLLLIIIVYFLPTILACNSRHKNKDAIFIVNVFLGWTLLGWVVALAWSVTK